MMVGEFSVVYVCIPVKICLNASLTPVESRAEVSMKARLFLSAKAIASSVLTARLCLRSLYIKQYLDFKKRKKTMGIATIKAHLVSD